jgi:hypothetical protein
MLERRRWTFRNLARMNHLLELVRLHLNRHGNLAGWARVIEGELEQTGRPASETPLDLHRRRGRTRVVPASL